MGLCKVSSYLLFSLLIAYKDYDKLHNLKYSEINQKAKNKIRSAEKSVCLKSLSKPYIEDLINCTGNTIFRKKQSIYYTKAENIYAIFYGWQSTLRYTYDAAKLWNIVESNLKEHCHYEQNEINNFSAYRNKNDFEKAIYKHYKKITQILKKTELRRERK